MIDLPSDLMPLEPIIKSTSKPFIYFDLTQQDKDLPSTDSKLGGRPYFTSAEAYPKDKNGQPMLFFGQINFSEIPHLENFPDSGLLQFFVADDQSFGQNLSNLTDQTGFRVIYHTSQSLDPNMSLTRDQYGIPALPENFFFYPVQKMTFHLDTAPVTLTDYRCQLDQDYYYDELSDKSREYYWDKLAQTAKHKIGGYGHFGQDDPRFLKEHDYPKYSEILFQLLSVNGDDRTKIIMGRSGRGTLHFMIKPEDLKNLDFSKVLYTWDSY